MLVGPPVQDVWLVVRGRGEEADRQRDVLLAGYEQMRAFDRAELQLIEPLRGLRMIHYAGWIARRWDDPSFPRAFPDWGSPRYWAEEIAALDETLSLLGPS
jgi:Ser/Thr protein kinase RdoA (MazF antagonist)